ncbi:hypothetical protein SeMB42_g06630 [Synchytrium endobioticum]|uniref:Uncharacterized protein n=2 Tax=Synchytrium endobioticum TaxID=286115 RepID=A0A507CKZ1_9FUNG|nr:hypothetical protein SeMB42_g06630 [Synchytrium endobioticum]
MRSLYWWRRGGLQEVPITQFYITYLVLFSKNARYGVATRHQHRAGLINHDSQFFKTYCTCTERKARPRNQIHQKSTPYLATWNELLLTCETVKNVSSGTFPPPPPVRHHSTMHASLILAAVAVLAHHCLCIGEGPSGMAAPQPGYPAQPDGMNAAPPGADGMKAPPQHSTDQPITQTLKRPFPTYVTETITETAKIPEIKTVYYTSTVKAPYPVTQTVAQYVTLTTKVPYPVLETKNQMITTTVTVPVPVPTKQPVPVVVYETVKAVVTQKVPIPVEVPIKVPVVHYEKVVVGVPAKQRRHGKKEYEAL